MSTTQTQARPPEPSGQPSEGQPEKRRLLGDISLVQVVGSALAAVSATVAASYLGVAGTVIGAALASVFATAGGTIYTQSLRRTKDVVVRSTQVVRDAPAARTVTVRHEEGAAPRAATQAAPQAHEPDHTTSLRALADTTAAVQREDVHADRDAVDRSTEWSQVLRPVDPTTVVRAEVVPDEPPAAVVEAPARPSAATVLRRRWRPIALTAAAIALVSVAAVSVLELAVGHPLSDSGSAGRTSVGELTRGSGSGSGSTDGGSGDGDRSSQQDDQDTERSRDDEPDDTATEPSEPTPSPTPSAQSPSATPTPESTPTPSARPSVRPSATPSPRS